VAAGATADTRVKPSHLFLLALICLCWGLNLVATRWVVADLGVDPLFYAFFRFAVIGLLLLPFLLPAPEKWGTVALAGVCIGGGNFAFLFLALQVVPAGTVAVVGQIGLPITTLLSVMFLGERIAWRRGLGMTLAVLGVVILSWRPREMAFTVGVLLVVGAALMGSVGAIVMKRMPTIPTLKFQAWTAWVSVPPTGLLSLGLEDGQWASVMQAGPGFWGALAFSVLAVTVFAHSMFYWLLQRHEVTLISPLTLMTPLWAVLFGMLLLNETLDARMMLGGAIALLGVAIVAVRPNATLPRFWLTWFSGRN
jgi:O-acetylserine/cysteine efflux transporter